MIAIVRESISTSPTIPRVSLPFAWTLVTPLGTDPEHVTLCLDAHWICRGAGNSAVALFDVVKLYGPRVTELHLRQSVDNVWTEALSEGDIPGAFEMPQRNITLTLEGGASRQRPGPPGNTGLDYRWQLVLVLSRICRKLGLPIPEEAARYRSDDRALVRRAFRCI